MKKYSKEEKAMWLEDWQQSGKKAWAYAKENGLIPQTFNSWIKPKSKESKSTFVELPREALQSTRLVQELQIEKGDIRIRIPLDPVLCEVRDMISKLGQVI